MTKRSFADIALETLFFDESSPVDQLVLGLIDTSWVQRLRRISQTGNTLQVYMYAEHSRFGHSLGVAYLASLVCKHLLGSGYQQVSEWHAAVCAAALLHDIGHCAPGSHLAERVWDISDCGLSHEDLGIEVILGKSDVNSKLKSFDEDLPRKVAAILRKSASIPKWTIDIISGDGWNVDRGNWSILDSTMCAVTYGRYNYNALIDALHIAGTAQELVISETRLDALTHFFMARDSMYRQIYQHRVLQAADALTSMISKRAFYLASVNKMDFFADKTMTAVLKGGLATSDQRMELLFAMDENWWGYHLSRWRDCEDAILADLASRLLDRRLFKTIRLEGSEVAQGMIIARAREVSSELGFEPDYYVREISQADSHRSGVFENPPKVLLENGELRSVSDIEPTMISLLQQSPRHRKWLAIPQEVKEKLGLRR